jgi:hypothetical protein
MILECILKKQVVRVMFGYTDKVENRSFVQTVMNLRIPQKIVLLGRCETLTFEVELCCTEAITSDLLDDGTMILNWTVNR